MPDYNGESASILSPLAPSPGAVMMWRQNREYDRELRDDQLRSQRESRRLQMVNHAEASLDPQQYLIGEGTIDAHTAGQLASAQSDIFRYIKDNPSVDPADVAYMVSQATGPIAAAHAKQKAIAQDIDKNVALAKADLPILNDSRLRDMARKQALLKQLPNGGWTYKSPDELNTGTNYIQDIINNNPEAVVDNTYPLTQSIQSLKTNKLKGSTGDMYAGVHTKNGYTAALSPFRDLDVAADGTVNGLKYKTEDKYIPGGGILKVMPEEQFALALGNPNARLAFYKLWNENKGRYGMQGVPNDSPVSNVMQRKFLLDYLQHTNVDPSEFQDMRDVTKSAEVTGMELGQGTRMQQWEHKESVKQEHAKDRIEDRQKNTEKNIETRFDNSVKLKGIAPARQTTKPKKKTGAADLN